MKAEPEGKRMIISKIKSVLISKRMLYTLCFFFLMVIDWTRGSQVGSTWAWTVNMTGVVMAIILFSAYDFKTFLKPVYLVYSAVCVIVLPLAYWWWNLHQEAIYRDKLLTAVLNVWLLGVLLIRLLLDVFVNKTKKLHFSKLEIIAIALLFWMFISVNEDVWPIWFLIMFELFYHTDYTKKDMTNMKQGLLNGIILGFFVLQGAAFVFRPFDDEHYRYCGIYGNCNINALFYCVVWIAFLIKLYYCRKNHEKWWKTVLCFLFSGALLGFMILTISKTAWISALMVAFFYIIFADFVLLKQKARKVTLSIFTFLLVMCISIPVVFSAVRYIPPIFHHPIWYDGEYTEEKVHSFDPWNSEKYVSFDNFIGEAFQRVKPYIDLISEKIGLQMSVVYAADDTIVMDYDQETMRNYASAIGRIYIWKYYIQNGTIMGHSSTEGHNIGVENWYVWHAQNMFVQLWYYYGIPSAILFVIALVGAIICSIRKIVKGNDAALICLLYLVLFGAYGLFECVWYPGQMILFLALFTPKFLQNDSKETMD